MFLFDFVKNRLTSPTEPIHVNVNEVVNEDGWVEVRDGERGLENFVSIEMPEIMAIEDRVVPIPRRSAPLSPLPNNDEARRRQEVRDARARTAQRKIIEKAFFADPESGKDVRLHKVATKRNPKKSYPVSTPRNHAQYGLQRSKNSSGKSNDRKVHMEFDIFTFADNN